MIRYFITLVFFLKIFFSLSQNAQVIDDFYYNAFVMNKYKHIVKTTIDKEKILFTVDSTYDSKEYVDVWRIHKEEIQPILNSKHKDTLIIQGGNSRSQTRTKYNSNGQITYSAKRIETGYDSTVYFYDENLKDSTCTYVFNSRIRYFFGDEDVKEKYMIHYYYYPNTELIARNVIITFYTDKTKPVSVVQADYQYYDNGLLKEELWKRKQVEKQREWKIIGKDTYEYRWFYLLFADKYNIILISR